RFDFRSAIAIIDSGYKGAEQQAVQLRHLSLDEETWYEHLAERQSKRRTGVPIPTDLEVTGVDTHKAREIEEVLKEEIGRRVRTKSLEHKLSEIRGGGRYESLGYEIVQLDNEDRLRIRVREKNYGPPFIYPVIQMHSDTL